MATLQDVSKAVIEGEVERVKAIPRNCSMLGRILADY